MGEDHRRSWTACRRAPRAESISNGVPGVLASGRRSHRTSESARVYHEVPEGRSRAQDFDRLPAKQPNQHVGMCTVPTRAAGGDGVDAARLERVAGAVATLDVADRAAAARPSDA